MTDARDPIDPFRTDALLDDPSSAGSGALASMLQDLGGPALPSELVDEAAVVARMQAAVEAGGSVTTSPGRGRATKRVVALAAVGSLAFGGVAAAAAGVPVPVVSGVVDEIDEFFSPEPGPVLESVPGDDGPVDGQPDGSGAEGSTEGADPEGSSEEPGNSGRARTDCGKKDAEPTGDPECDDAENHGDFVNNGNGKNGDGNNGNGAGNGGGNGTGNEGVGNGNPDREGAGTENGTGNTGDAKGQGVGTNNADGSGVDGDNGNGNGNGNGNKPVPDESTGRPAAAGGPPGS